MSVEFFFKEIVPNYKTENSVYWLQDYFYFGKNKRIATVTDVKFINESRLIVAHRSAAKLFLVEIIDNSLNIIDTLVLKNNNEYFHPDCICINQNIIYMTEFTNSCCIVQILDNKLIFIKTIKLDDKMVYHGCQSINNIIYFGSMYSKDKNTPLTILDPKTHQIYNIKTNTNVRIKSIVSFKNYLILGGDTSEYGNYLRDSYIKLYTINDNYEIKFLDEFLISKSQIDGSVFYKEHFFITLHSDIGDCGYIYVGNIVNDKLNIIRKVKCNKFPHGIDIYENKLVYTSYANESITIENLDKYI